MKSTYRTPFPMNRGRESTSSWSTEYTGRGPTGAGKSYVSSAPKGGTVSYTPSLQIFEWARVSSTNVSGLKRQMNGCSGLEAVSPSRTLIASTRSIPSAARRAITLLRPGSSPIPMIPVRPAASQSALRA